MNSAGHMQLNSKSAKAKLNTKTFPGVSENPSVIVMDKIKMRFSTNPTAPKNTTKTTRITASVSLIYKLKVDTILSVSAGN